MDEDLGRFPFNQKFRKFRYRMKWNGDFRKIHFENFGQPLEVVAFPGNLEIPGFFCAIGHSISLDAQSQFLQRGLQVIITNATCASLPAMILSSF